jgi:hypothetical protein
VSRISKGNLFGLDRMKGLLNSGGIGGGNGARGVLAENTKQARLHEPIHPFLAGTP